MSSAAENLQAWFSAGLPVWAQQSLGELVARGEWSELNDRFYRYLEFGTGGMRGRTIGQVTAQAETGQLSAGGTPEHANVGSNLLNDFTLIRAIIGLHRYVHGYLQAQASAARPKLVIAHDVRHFSRHFCELAASTWARLGGEAIIFDGPRSTPQLSFTVRHLSAHTGAVITASHNPAHDNGFKAYFTDGAQVISPQDKGIIAEVDAVPLSAVQEFLTKDLRSVVTLGSTSDAAY
jgi:phosphoglucomutase